MTSCRDGKGLPLTKLAPSGMLQLHAAMHMHACNRCIRNNIQLSALHQLHAACVMTALAVCR